MSHPITMDREIAELYADHASTLTPDNMLEVAHDGSLHPQHVAEREDMIRALCDELVRLRGVVDERLTPMERLRRVTGDLRMEVHVQARDGAGAHYIAGALGAPVNVDSIRSTVADRTVWELPQGRIVVGVELPSVLDQLASERAEVAALRNRVVELEESLAAALACSTEVADAAA